MPAIHPHLAKASKIDAKIFTDAPYFHRRRHREAHRDIAGFHDQPADDSRAAAGDDRYPTRKALVSRAPVGFSHR